MGIQQYYIDKKINKAIKNSIKANAEASILKIQKVAIFIDEETSFNEKDFKALQKLTQLSNTHFKILTFKKKRTDYNKFRGTVVIQNDVNWQGKITSKAVNEYLNETFDLLIDYTQADNQEKQLIISKIKAFLKVGYKDNKDELYDMTIQVNPSEVSLFNKEMVHYLSILNLI